MSQVGEIVYVNGRPERVVERGPVYDGEGGILCYFIRTEPVSQEEADAQA